MILLCRIHYQRPHFSLKKSMSITLHTWYISHDTGNRAWDLSIQPEHLDSSGSVYPVVPQVCYDLWPDSHSDLLSSVKLCDVLGCDAQFQIAPNISDPGGCCIITYTSETHIKLKFRETSFEHNLLFNCQIVLKFCTEHGSALPFSVQIFKKSW